MADVKASDIKGDASTAFETLDEEWFAFMEAKAKEIAIEHAKKPDVVADGEINHYATFLDNMFHEIMIQRLRKTARYKAACLKADMDKGRIDKVLEDLPELAALKTVLAIYGRSIDEAE